MRNFFPLGVQIGFERSFFPLGVQIVIPFGNVFLTSVACCAVLFPVRIPATVEDIFRTFTFVSIANAAITVRFG